MKKLLKKVLLALGAFMPSLGLAQAIANPPKGAGLPTLITSSDQLVVLLQTVLNWIFFALVFVAIVFILLIAFNFVTKGGKNKDDVKDEWQKLFNILIGVAVALAAKGLVYLVCSLFTVQSCSFF